ncbi:MAG: NAD(P)H-dependent oxidoreductase [Acidimicrobiia bacterium]|nr:NAD(P)H-dependent oxidoreductase [Acidimicrobiia bacterium]
MTIRILAVSGSLRAGSSNAGLCRTAARLAPAGVEVEHYEGLGDLAFYNPDIDEPDHVPAAAARWRAAVASADAVVFAVAEYDFGPSAVLKNALDWASRPLGSAALCSTTDAEIEAPLAARLANLVGAVSADAVQP